ncbi:hypothetical protein JNK13_10600 [bacterium]|nr:hypothetical protein [bacterium]
MLRRINQFYGNLKPSERRLIALTSLAGLIFIGVIFKQWSDTYLEQSSRLIVTRKADAEKLPQLIARYLELSKRLEHAKKTFEASQLTFEQVTTELDRIVKESIGSDNYDLQRGRTTEDLGIDYEKQEFILNVKSITLEQLVKLLHKITYGDRPLFLGKIDLLKGFEGKAISATIEIGSVRKKSSPTNTEVTI